MPALIHDLGPVICTPVLCSCLHPLSPHADSRLSYRCPSASISIEYVFARPCNILPYKQCPNFIVFPQFDYHKSCILLNIHSRTLCFYLAHSAWSLTLRHSAFTQLPPPNCHVM